MRGRLRSPRPPRAVEVSLERRIRGIGELAWGVLEDRVLPVYDRELRGDDLSDVLRGSLLELGRRLREEYSDRKLAAWTRGAGASTDRTHAAQFYSHLADAIGVQVSVDEELAPGVLRAWSSSAAAEIKSVRDTVVPGLAREIEEAFSAGVRHEELAKRWRARGLPLEFGTIEGRAKVIARDQLGKLNGRLTEARHRELGIDEYTWRTAGDQRVRDRHASRNGQRFAWDRPPSDGHPGQPVLCRCSAEAVIDLGEVVARPNASIAAPGPVAVPLAASGLPGFGLSA